MKQIKKHDLKNILFDEQFTLKSEELIEETKSEKIGNIIRITVKTAGFIGGGVADGQGIIKEASSIG